MKVNNKTLKWGKGIFILIGVGNFKREQERKMWLGLEVKDGKHVKFPVSNSLQKSCEKGDKQDRLLIQFLALILINFSYISCEKFTFERIKVYLWVVEGGAIGQ